jgi:hypothetical protein
MVDEGLTHDRFVFATTGERCRYIGLSPRRQQEWLRNNPDRWCYLNDVLQKEAASLQWAAESEIDCGAEPAGPNDQTASPSTGDNGDDEDDVTMADTLAGNCSPPDEPTSAPTLTRATDESAKTKPKASVNATSGETTERKAETTPQTRLTGGRQLKRQKLPAEISKRARKRSPERMRLYLDSIADFPSNTLAAKKAGVNRRTPEYWLKCSKAGNEGYDIEWRGVTANFHEHYTDAEAEGVGKLEEVAYQGSTKGYDVVLTYKGRVTYKEDPHLLSLGLRGPDAYLRDENGNLVPETVPRVDPKMTRWMLARRHPKIYGKESTIDKAPQGGVLVIGSAPKPQKFEQEFDPDDVPGGDE